MNKKALVSIIIPVFNSEQYIERCLQSIINQTWENIEIIIIDDLSTDHTSSIVNEYCNQNSNIYYKRLSQKRGTGGARNLGMELAKGTYFSFVDSDDWIDLSFIERMVVELEKTKSEIAICGVLTEFNNPKDAIVRYEYEFNNVINQYVAFRLLTRTENQDCFISPIACNKMYRADFIKKNDIVFLENSFNEDDYFNFLAFYYVQHAVFTTKVYYHYFQRNGSVTKTLGVKHIDDFIYCFSKLKLFLDEKNLYHSLKPHYLSYFEKCLTFLLEMIDNSGESEIVKKKYIYSLFIKCKDIIIPTEYLQYVGIRRIRRFMDYRIK